MNFTVSCLDCVVLLLVYLFIYQMSSSQSSHAVKWEHRRNPHLCLLHFREKLRGLFLHQLFPTCFIFQMDWDCLFFVFTKRGSWVQHLTYLIWYILHVSWKTVFLLPGSTIYPSLTWLRQHCHTISLVYSVSDKLKCCLFTCSIPKCAIDNSMYPSKYILFEVIYVNGISS